MRAVGVALALAAAIGAPAWAYQRRGVRFEAWDDWDVTALLSLDSSAGSCSTGPLQVLVRISSCFNTADFATIDEWVGSSLAESFSSFKVDDTPIPLQFVARLEDPESGTDGCSPDATLSDDSSFKAAITTMTIDDSAAPLSNPDTVITFVEGNGELSTVSAGFTLQFRVCSWSCAAVETDKLLSDLSELDKYPPRPIARNFPCSHIPGSGAVKYKDDSGVSQCMCMCPTGSTLEDGVCKSGGEHQSKCAWNCHGPGFKCHASMSGEPHVRLVSDCHIPVPIPRDTYVGSDHTNCKDGGPRITVSAARGDWVSATIDDTWHEYLTQPNVELDKIKLTSFGIFELTMNASDYYNSAICDGCVAVVDSFAPRAVQQCVTASWGSPSSGPTDITTQNLQTAIDKETSFELFDDNVLNNGPSERADIKQQTQQDWFATTYSDMTANASSCFHDFVVRELLENPTASENPLLTETDEAALENIQCSRCCAKHTVLREYYYDYQCDTALEDTPRLIAEGDSCSFEHCIRIPATSLVEVMAMGIDAEGGHQSGEDTTIYRSSSCSTLGSSCTYKEAFNSLFSLLEYWQNDLPNEGDYLSGYDPHNYIFWRYKLGDSDWAVADDTTELEFSSKLTPVSLQAWTQCGMARQSDFEVDVSESEAPPPPPPPPTHEYVVTTREGDSEPLTPGNVKLLARLPAKCAPGEAMTGFKIIEDNGNRAHYEVQCVARDDLTQDADGKETEWGIGWSGASSNIGYLSPHIIDCGTSAINGFQLEADEQNSAIRYDYTCTDTPSPLTRCESLSTPETTKTGNGPDNLKLQSVACPDGTFLTNLGLQVDESTIWYTYTCCARP